ITTGSLPHELREAGEVHVAARDQHADLPAAHVDLLLEYRRGRQAARGLDDHFHARGKKFHRRDELGVADGDDVLHQSTYHRERVNAEVLGLRAVGYGLRRVDVHDLPGAEALLAVVARCGLHAEDVDPGIQRLRRYRTAGDESPAAEAHD